MGLVKGAEIGRQALARLAMGGILLVLVTMATARAEEVPFPRQFEVARPFEPTCVLTITNSNVI